MASLYVESSALVKRYIREIGTNWVRSQTSLFSGNHLFVARITSVEIMSTISRRVRAGAIGRLPAVALMNQLRQEFANYFRIVGISRRLIESALDLAETHGLRGYDAIQLAAALRANDDSKSVGLGRITLISALTPN